MDEHEKLRELVCDLIQQAECTGFVAIRKGKSTKFAFVGLTAEDAIPMVEFSTEVLKGLKDAKHSQPA